MNEGDGVSAERCEKGAKEDRGTKRHSGPDTEQARKTICGLIASNQLILSSQKAAVAANVVLPRRHTCPKLHE